MPSPPRIALLVDTSTGWGRGIIKGVISYAEKHGPWDIHLRPSDTSRQLRLPNTWKGDGVIARVVTTDLANHLQSTNLPVVNVSATEFGKGIPRVTHDGQSVVDLAIDHFAQRGIRSFGYFGAHRRQYSIARGELYAELCRQRGFDCSIFSHDKHYCDDESLQARLGAWLKTLPSTTGILTWGVERGVDIINAAVTNSMQVPEQIAVLGGDDDELICRAVRPTLSGIRFTGERIGFEAAHMLDRMLRGEPIDNTDVLIKPTGVTARGSTDVLAIRNREVAAAVRFIRENVSSPLRLTDVAEAITAAPRSLQRGFRQELRHSFSDEVIAARVERAKELLVETDWPIPRISEACGYGSPEYMATVFRKVTGTTPRSFRQQVRGS